MYNIEIIIMQSTAFTQNSHIVWVRQNPKMKNRTCLLQLINSFLKFKKNKKERKRKRVTSSSGVHYQRLSIQVIGI